MFTRLIALTILWTACARSDAPPADAGAAPQAADGGAPAATPFPDNPEEPHLTNLRMLTHGGQNAEAYFSADGRQLIFQATHPGKNDCDQIFIMNVDGSDVHRVSSGTGRTTCAYFFPAGDRILYSSTHLVSPECPPKPDYSRGYVWALYDYDIFTARPDGSDVRPLTQAPGYDAEATIATDGSRIVFTSTRDGDLDIYTMNPDGTDVTRLTDEPGYDGGAFFSPDGSKIVYRAYHPTDPADLAEYRSLLKDKLVRPTTLDIYVMDADGSNKHRLTHNGAANFAPYFHPDGRRVIFASNVGDPSGRDFDLYMIGVDGTGLERITKSPEFDGFPMFSPDGSQLVFASNRGGQVEGETNVFLADWIEHPAASASGAR